VFVRNLAAGETLLVKAAALVYKDPGVRMTLKIDYPMAYGLGAHRLMWIHLVGPGRVAVRSAYEREESGIENIVGQSPSPFLHDAAIAATMKAASAKIRANLSPSTAPKMDYRHELIAEMAAGALAAGEISAEEMTRIRDAAREHGLSEYDIRLIINHVKSHGQ
jgi:hypothetical protein